MLWTVHIQIVPQTCQCFCLAQLYKLWCLLCMPVCLPILGNWTVRARHDVTWTVTGLWDPDHSQWLWVSHSDSAGTDDGVRWRFSSHGFQRGQSFSTTEFEQFAKHLVHGQFVEVDLEHLWFFMRAMTFPLRAGDRWRRLSCGCVVEFTPQGLPFAWDDFDCLLVSLWYSSNCRWVALTEARRQGFSPGTQASSPPSSV